MDCVAESNSWPGSGIADTSTKVPFDKTDPGALVLRAGRSTYVAVGIIFGLFTLLTELAGSFDRAMRIPFLVSVGGWVTLPPTLVRFT